MRVCMATSGTTKASPQRGGLHVRLSSSLLGPAAEGDSSLSHPSTLKALPPYTSCLLHTKCVLLSPFLEDSPCPMNGPFLVYWILKLLQFKSTNLNPGKQNPYMRENIQCLVYGMWFTLKAQSMYYNFYYFIFLYKLIKSHYS